MINSVFQALDRDASLRVIQLDPGSINSAFAIKACIERGEFVALLADRVGIGDEKRTGPVEFLGDRADLPARPVLPGEPAQCPLIFMVALRMGDGRYEAFAERVAEKVIVDGPEDLDALAGDYARRLERVLPDGAVPVVQLHDYWSDDPGT